MANRSAVRHPVAVGDGGADRHDAMASPAPRARDLLAIGARARSRGRPVFRSRALGATAREAGPVDDVLVILLTSQVCGYYTAYGERAPVASRLADVECRRTDPSSMLSLGRARPFDRQSASGCRGLHDGVTPRTAGVRASTGSPAPVCRAGGSGSPPRVLPRSAAPSRRRARCPPGLQHAPEEDHAILDVDADLPLRDARAAVQLTLDLLRERQVIQRLRLPPARVDRATGDADRVRLGAPRTHHGAALAAAQPRAACGRERRGAGDGRLVGRGSTRVAPQLRGRPRLRPPAS